MAQKTKTRPIVQTTTQELTLATDDTSAMVAPYHKGPPPMLSPELVEKLADLVVERVMAKIGVHPLHGGGQGFESPQLHLPSRSTSWGYCRENPAHTSKGTARVSSSLGECSWSAPQTIVSL